jgi:hypothetical protein
MLLFSLKLCYALVPVADNNCFLQLTTVATNVS